jgi:endoglucanase
MNPMRNTLLALTGATLAISACTPSSAGPNAPAIPEAPVQACINLGGALEAPNEGDWGYTIRREDMARIRAAGFDTVRLPVKWSVHTRADAPYRIDADFLARVDEVVSWALSEDLQIIVNVHHYDEIVEDPDTHLPRLTAIWTQLSRHWADAPPGLMFEFLNEPHSEMSPARTDQMNRDLLALVRAQHPDRWVVLGGSHWGHWKGLLEADMPYDRKAMTTFHFYDPFDFTHQGATWVDPPRPSGVPFGTPAERREISETLARMATWRDRTGMPLLLGEFGVFREADLSARADWTAFVREQSEAVGFGWCYWEWGTGFPVYDLANERWIEPVRDALIPPAGVTPPAPAR